MTTLPLTTHSESGPMGCSWSSVVRHAVCGVVVLLTLAGCGRSSSGASGSTRLPGDRRPGDVSAVLQTVKSAVRRGQGPYAGREHELAKAVRASSIPSDKRTDPEDIQFLERQRADLAGNLDRLSGLKNGSDERDQVEGAVDEDIAAIQDNGICQGITSTSASPSTSAPTSTSVSIVTATTLRSTTTVPLVVTSIPSTTSASVAVSVFAGQYRGATGGAGEAVINADGTGRFDAPDLTACPSCSTASAPRATIDFRLTSASKGPEGGGYRATGVITAESDPADTIARRAGPVGSSITASVVGKGLSLSFLSGPDLLKV